MGKAFYRGKNEHVQRYPDRGIWSDKDKWGKKLSKTWTAAQESSWNVWWKFTLHFLNRHTCEREGGCLHQTFSDFKCKCHIVDEMWFFPWRSIYKGGVKLTFLFFPTFSLVSEPSNQCNAIRKSALSSEFKFQLSYLLAFVCTIFLLPLWASKSRSENRNDAYFSGLCEGWNKIMGKGF